MEINPRSYVPVYLQLADVLREKIHNGELAPGSEFPGEHEMASQYNVGRPAVRQALGVLRAEALVVTRRGEGTRVREQPERRPVEIGPGARVWFRQPTPAERVEMRIDEGVGLVVIEVEGEEPQVLPSDEIVIVAAAGRRRSQA